MSFSNFSMKQKDVLLETQSNEKLNSEAENSLVQSEKFDYGKTGFETKTCSNVLTLITYICTIFRHCNE